MPQIKLPKPPRDLEKFGNDVNLWFVLVYKRISEALQLTWDQIDTAGSALDDLTIRAHDLLTDIGEVDPSDTDATRNKHLSNLDAYTWNANDAKAVDDTDTDTTKDKHVSNALAKSWTDSISAGSGHAGSSNAHGAGGDIVGTTDYCTLTVGGVVLLCPAITDASASTVSGSTSSVSVTSADATDLASVITLANETKADVNTLVSNVNTLAGDLDSAITDLNAVVTKLNTHLANLRTAKQLEI